MDRELTGLVVNFIGVVVNAGILLFIALQVYLQNKQIDYLSKQLNQQKEQLIYSQISELHDKLISRKLKDCIFRIHNAKIDVTGQHLSLKHRNDIDHVLNTYDLVGYQAKKGILQKEAVIETEWTVVRRLWKRLEPFIEKRRKNPGDEQYKQYFCWLNDEAEKYRVKNGLPDVIEFTVTQVEEPRNQVETGNYKT